MILNVYLEGGAVMRVDGVEEWKTRQSISGARHEVTWKQTSSASVELLSINPAQIIAVTRQEEPDEG